MSQEQAVLILVKPDGLKKSLTGNILTRLSETKLEIVAAKMVRVSKGLAVEHYKHLEGKLFFEGLIKYLQGEFHDRRKVMALVYCCFIILNIELGKVQKWVIFSIPQFIFVDLSMDTCL